MEKAAGYVPRACVTLTTLTIPYPATERPPRSSIDVTYCL